MVLTGDQSSYSLTDHLLELVGAVPDVQDLFDQENWAQQTALDIVSSRKNSFAKDPFRLPLTPSRLELYSYTVEAKFLFSSKQRSDLDVGIRLGGRLINFFLELRYYGSQSYRDHLTITVESVPLTIQNHAKEKNHDYG